MSTSVDLYKHRSDRVTEGEQTTSLSLYEAIEQVVNRIARECPELIKSANKSDGQDQLEVEIEKIIRSEKVTIEDLNQDEVVKEVKNFILGYAVLQVFIEDEDVNNIFVNRPDDVWIQKKDKLMHVPTVDFGSRENLLGFVRAIPAALGGEINKDQAIAIFPDERYKLRIMLGIDPIHHISPMIVIRKHRIQSYTLTELKELGMMNEEMLQVLENIAKDPKSIVIGGRGGVGKTTLLRGICEAIPPTVRMLTMEEFPELYLKRRNTVQQVVRRDGRARDYSLSHLADFGNLAKIDIYTFGEIRGKEAMPFFDGAFAGNITLNTSHTATSRHMIPKLSINMKKGGTDIPFDVLQEMLFHSIRLIIQVDNYKVTEIVEILADEEGMKRYNQIYSYVIEERTSTRLQGHFERVGEFKSADLMYLNDL